MMVTFLLFAYAAGWFILLKHLINKGAGVFTGWNYKFDDSVKQTIVYIPEPGYYSINIKRNNPFSFLNRRIIDTDCFPKDDFTVHRAAPGETAQYFYKSGINLNKGFMRDSTPVGYFEARDSGEYLITNMRGGQFPNKEEFIIQEYISEKKKGMLLFGIIMSVANVILGIVFTGLSMVER